MRAFGSFLLYLFAGFCGTGSYAQGNAPPQVDRVAAHADLAPMNRLSGHVPMWARAEVDEGPVADGTPLRVTLVLTRSAQRQAAFTQLLADQQNPASPRYHKWLRPQEVGEQYGPTQHDVDALSAWLTSRGLSVTETAPSRVFLHASAPAAILARAFSTSLHSFRIHGQVLRAPTIDPAIPNAFVPLVGSVTGLADTPLEPMHQHRSMPTERPGPAERSGSPRPEDTTSAGNHYVTPGDFAVIFDLKPTYGGGYNGTGQKVAIIGRSRIAATDISLFEANTGLATNLPNTIIPPTGVDPGVTGTGDQSEATLDAARVLGTAPGVQADLVVSGSAGGFNGIYVAAQYEVQTLLDPVMNISFGSCEVYAGPSQVNLWDTLFAQAASEGISVFVSAADSGAATCDAQFGQVPTYQFRSINYICASSYATCVGGTELVDTNSSVYWSSTNSTGLVSALSYIPEGAWNDPTSVTSSGTSYVAASGGGGASIYVPKPWWQTGTGVPADGARDVPDISFPASGHDGYYACYAASGGDCANNHYEYFYGTSAAAPAMAAITAILNQKMGSSQGNLNPLLYRIAAGIPSAFHDATPASSGVSTCSTAVPSLCNNSTPGVTGLTGGVAGYALTSGYDQATGLGSLDVSNFLNAAAMPVSALAPGKLKLTGSAATIAATQTAIFSATFTTAASGTPTGTVQFYANASPLGSAVPLISDKATTPATPFPGAGSYDITALYSGDASFAQAAAPGISLTVTGLTPAAKISIPSTTFQLGDAQVFTVTVGAGSGSAIPTGLVRFYAVTGGTGSYIATVPLSGGSATAPIPTFAAGTFTVTAYYLGDTVYSSSSSASVTYTVQKFPVALLLSAAANTVGIGGFREYTILFLNLPTASTYPAASGTLQLYSNGTALGSPIALSSTSNATLSIVQPQSPPILYSTPGAYTITVGYSGDANYAPFTGGATTTTVLTTPAAYQISASPTSLAFSAGSSMYNVSTLFAAAKDGFEGTVSLACAVTYNGVGSSTSLPTCTLSNSTTPLGPKQTGMAGTVTINTVAASRLRTPPVHAQVPAAGLWRRLGGGSVFCALMVCCISRRRRFWRAAGSVFSLSVLAFLSGCGSGSGNSSTPSNAPGTTPGSYTVTVTSSTTTSGIPVPPATTIAVTVN